MNGFLIANKPTGITSSNLVVYVRKRLPRGPSIGHGGTLDPEASGVLPLCIGSATRLFDYIIDRQKVYEAVLQLGRETDTQDATGQTVREVPMAAGEAEIRGVLPRFSGDILQIPPMYSAIKRDGVRMYQLARAGESVELAPRPVKIDSIEYVSDEGGGRHRLRVSCHRGVYIRTLCHDIGQALGGCAHMASLRRTRVGEFSVENAVTLEQLSEIAENGGIEQILLPMDAPISYLPALSAGEEWRKLARCGNPLPLSAFSCPVAPGAHRLYVGGQFAGIGERDGDAVRFRCMLLRDGEQMQNL